MLVFTDDEIEVNRADGSPQTCVVCERRRAMWNAVVQTIPDERDGIFLRKTDEKSPMCGWCVLYSLYCQWGYENREEILHVGRAAQEHAAKSNKTVPALDERGRLVPEDAERFMLGVAFTSKMIRQTVGKMARLVGEK